MPWEQADADRANHAPAALTESILDSDIVTLLMTTNARLAFVAEAQNSGRSPAFWARIAACLLTGNETYLDALGRLVGALIR